MFSFSQPYRSRWYKAVSIVFDLIPVYSYCSCQSYFKARIIFIETFLVFSIHIYVVIKTLLFFFIAFMLFLRLLFSSDVVIT